MSITKQIIQNNGNYSIGLPMYANVDANSIEFTLMDSDSSTVFYNGIATAYPNDTSISIEISNILQNYIKNPTDFFYVNDVSVGLENTIKKTIQFNSTAQDYVFNVYYDYSGTNITIANGNFNKIINRPIFKTVYVGQMLFQFLRGSGVNFTNDTKLIFIKDGSTIGNPVILPIEGNYNNYIAYNVGYGSVPVYNLDGVQIAIEYNNSGYNSDYVYTIETCLPDNTFTLYYVNQYGAIDFLHCTGVNSTTDNLSPYQITTYASPDNPLDFALTNIQNSVYNSYTLNTPQMNDQQSKLITNLFNSNKIWLQDWNNNIIKSVIITDKSVKIKRYQTDKIFNYTIKLRDSQTYTIK